MTPLSINSLCSILFEMNWQHNGVKHKETYFARNVNLWRDYFPAEIKQGILGSKVGDKLYFELRPGRGEIPWHEQSLVKELNKSGFDGRMPDNSMLVPQYGRFYPKGRLTGLTNIFKSNITPFRVVNVDKSTLLADFNHPMAEKQVDLTVEIVNAMDKIDERGGACVDWIQTIIEGPGMQSRVNGRPTEFITENALNRQDDSPDRLFYEEPRLVTHIDSTAIETVMDIYNQVVPHNAEILDLMSSWKSHLPEGHAHKKVTGLGLNLEELAKNKQLTDYFVYDLNEFPVLPFKDRQYDAVICTVSVEYLTRPFAVFKDVARVLRPGGVFIVTFSNRWFPPKVVNIWQEIHEFERIGLVTEYFLDSGMYENINTVSVRGLKRPVDDKYYGEIEFSDPIYCVYGYKF